MAIIRLGPKRWRAFHAGLLTDGTHGGPVATVRVARQPASPGTSGRPGRLGEPTTVRLPAIRPTTGPGPGRLRVGFRRTPLQSRMGAMTVMVPLELEKLQLQVGGRPEEHPVQAFAPNEI